ncbi:MAG: DinB family protein [Nevskiales bacterium]|nr:DinB family protein [Nevskiales bacterium]
MNLRAHIELMASYNAWMNRKLYAAAATLPAEALTADRGAFFGSILGTLNHLVVGDTIWLQRFALHPSGSTVLEPVVALPTPRTLDETVCADLPSLSQRRQLLDDAIEAWAGGLADADLDQTLHYRSTRGVPGAKVFGALIMHFFNHQTHHRGQITTLLTQAGAEVGVTDLLMLIPDPPAT